MKATVEEGFFAYRGGCKGTQTLKPTAKYCCVSHGLRPGFSRCSRVGVRVARGRVRSTCPPPTPSELNTMIPKLSSTCRKVRFANGSWQDAESPFILLAIRQTPHGALGASEVCLVGEDPTCSVPVTLGMLSSVVAT